MQEILEEARVTLRSKSSSAGFGREVDTEKRNRYKIQSNLPIETTLRNVKNGQLIQMVLNTNDL